MTITDADGYATHTSYYQNGDIAETQTAAEYAAGTGRTVTYDADSDPVTETTHYGCLTASGCTPGITQKWYDGADRLVEIRRPQDPSDYYSYPWLNRYLYDLSANGRSASAPAFRNVTLAGHGNLFKTQEFVGTQATVPSNTTAWTSTGWTDISGASYDQLDRSTTEYKVVPAPTEASVTFAKSSLTYDATGQYGLLSARTSATGDTDTLQYDNVDQVVQDASSNAATGTLTYTYDPDGAVTDINSSLFGADIRAYDSDGNLISRKEPTGGGVTDPVILDYTYYGDDLRSGLTVQPESGTVPGFSTTHPTKAYSYRIDGVLSTETLYFNSKSYPFSWTYTGAGRPLTRNDPFASPAYQYTYDSSGRTQSLKMPNVSYTNIAHDVESEPTAFSAYGTTVANTFSRRGELLGEAYGSDSCSSPSSTAPYGFSSPPQWHNSKSANGFLFPQLVCTNGDGQPLVTEWDHNLGSVIGSQATNDQYSYDNGGRMSGTSSNKLFGRSPPIQVTCTSTTSRAYDGHNHLISISSTSEASTTGQTCYTYYPGNNLYQWGPNDRLIRVGTDSSSSPTDSTPPSPSSAIYYTAHWDGDSLLFSSLAAGIGNVNFDGLAEVYPSGIGYSQFPPWTIPGKYNFFVYDYNLAGGIDDARVSATPHSTYNAATPAAVSAPAIEGPVNAVGLGLVAVSRDSLTDGVINVAGVRTLEPGTTQWSSPDEANPSSASAYVWDNNNPYMFRDPSGYAPCTLGDTTGANNPNGGGCGNLGNGSIGGSPPNPSDVVPIGHPGMPSIAMGLDTGPWWKANTPAASSDDDDDFINFLAGIVDIIGTRGEDGWERIGQRSRVASEIGILRDAASGKGNFGIGTATAKDAARLGSAWVGAGARASSSGKAIVSADGLRQFRPPSFKPNLGRTQANFEQRWNPSGPWQSNGGTWT